MPRFALVASDVDGTLTDRQDQLRPAVKQALDDALAAGVQIVLATGRGPVAGQRVIDQIGYELPMVLANGAIVTEGLSQPPLLRAMLPGKVAREAIPMFREAGLEPMVYDDPLGTNLVVCERRHPDNAAFQERNPKRMLWVDDLAAFCDHEVMVVTCFGPEGRLRGFADTLAAALDGRGAVQPFWHPKYDAWAMDVAAAGCSKANGLRHYADVHGIAVEQMLAIGDSLNDLPMLQAAGFAVAMGNADDEVKDAADAVVADNDHDGVAEAIRRFVLDEVVV